MCGQRGENGVEASCWSYGYNKTENQETSFVLYFVSLWVCDCVAPTCGFTLISKA